MRAIVSRHVGPSCGLQPPIGDTGAAGKSDASVDDEQLAVGPVVQAVKAVPA